MSQEEKNKILFETLSHYLPSKLICHISDGENVDVDRVLTGVTINGCYFDGSEAFYGWNSFNIKPYLRPMSSMTEEEFLEYYNIKYNKVTYRNKWKRINVGKFHNIGIIPIEDYLDWLIINHFDYRGLIPMDLAIEITEENNPYK